MSVVCYVQVFFISITALILSTLHEKEYQLAVASLELEEKAFQPQHYSFTSWTKATSTCTTMQDMLSLMWWWSFKGAFCVSRIFGKLDLTYKFETRIGCVQLSIHDL